MTEHKTIKNSTFHATMTKSKKFIFSGEKIIVNVSWASDLCVGCKLGNTKAKSNSDNSTSLCLSFGSRMYLFDVGDCAREFLCLQYWCRLTHTIFIEKKWGKFAFQGWTNKFICDCSLSILLFSCTTPDQADTENKWIRKIRKTTLYYLLLNKLIIVIISQNSKSKIKNKKEEIFHSDQKTNIHGF